MPGVLDPNSSCGFNREVGKMAFYNMDPDLISTFNEDDTTDIGEIATRILMDPSNAGVTRSSSNSSTGSGESADSDGELPDNEQTVDLIQFIDGQDNFDDDDSGLHRFKCVDDNCSKCGPEPRNKFVKYGVRKDPFMGLVGDTERESSSACAATGSSSRMTNLDCDYDHSTEQQMKDQPEFKAWGHNPYKSDDFSFSSFSSTTIGATCFEDDTEEMYFPETPSPSSRSGTVTGDDSDVDIETIADTPRGADSCGYVTQDSSPALSPSSSPGPLRSLQNGSLLSILAQNSKGSPSSSSSTQSSPTSSKHISLSTCGISSKLSLAENLMAGRSSLLGQKRKFSKDKKCVTKAPSQPAYTHVLCNSNSVNFHDYAMSPAACAYPSSSSPSTSTETGRPTVLSKRVYKRKPVPVDASEKEKQHHHNQLERNRRQKLADLFVYLRDEVPKIANNTKASKVVILNESTVYIRELQRREKHQEDDISKELQKREMLKRQLRQLQAHASRVSVK